MDSQQLAAKLRSKGFKVTPQRLAICELVLSSKDHPTAEEIYQRIVEKYPTISLATVYHALHLLRDLGLLQELGFTEMTSRCDPNVSLHINIVCPKCGVIRDYETSSVKELWSKIFADLRFKPTGQRIDVYRDCDKCSKTHA